MTFRESQKAVSLEMLPIKILNHLLMIVNTIGYNVWNQLRKGSDFNLYPLLSRLLHYMDTNIPC